MKKTSRIFPTAVLVAVLFFGSISVVYGSIISCEPYQGNDFIRKCGDKYYDLSRLKGNDGQSLLVSEGSEYNYYMKFDHDGVPKKLPFECTMSEGVLAAQVRTDSGGCYSLGQVKFTNWDYDTDANQLTITASNGDGGRLTVVTVKCVLTKYSTVVASGESKPLEYDFDLSMPTNICGTTTPPKSKSSSKSTDAGAIVLGVFFGCIGLYFLGGMVFLGVVQSKRGPDIIPHREFWISIPLLIKDGAYFTMAKITGSAPRGSYSQI